VSRIVVILLRIHHDLLYFHNSVYCYERYHQFYPQNDPSAIQSKCDKIKRRGHCETRWDWRCTAKEKRPQWSEDWSIVISQSREPLGYPSVRDTIIVDVPSSYTKINLWELIDWGMDYHQSASFAQARRERQTRV
jgi:hypothetical protein